MYSYNYYILVCKLAYNLNLISTVPHVHIGPSSLHNWFHSQIILQVHDAILDVLHQYIQYKLELHKFGNKTVKFPQCAGCKAHGF